MSLSVCAMRTELVLFAFVRVRECVSVYVAVCLCVLMYMNNMFRIIIYMIVELVSTVYMSKLGL